MDHHAHHMEMDHSKMDHGDMGHGDMGGGHGPKCSMNVRTSASCMSKQPS